MYGKCICAHTLILWALLVALTQSLRVAGDSTKKHKLQTLAKVPIIVAVGKLNIEIFRASPQEVQTLSIFVVADQGLQTLDTFLEYNGVLSPASSLSRLISMRDCSDTNAPTKR